MRRRCTINLTPELFEFAKKRSEKTSLSAYLNDLVAADQAMQLPSGSNCIEELGQQLCPPYAADLKNKVKDADQRKILAGILMAYSAGDLQVNLDDGQ